MRADASPHLEHSGTRYPVADRIRPSGVTTAVLALLCVSVPIEVLGTNWGLGMSLTQITGVLLVVSAVLDRRAALNTMSGWYFTLLWYVSFSALSALVNDQGQDSAAIRWTLTMVQILVLMIIVYNCVLHNRSLLGLVVGSYVAGALVLAATLFSTYGLEAVFTSEERADIFGLDPNNSGSILAIACTLALSLSLATKRTVVRVTSLLSVFILAMALVATGSRASYLALMLGAATVFVVEFRRRSILSYKQAIALLPALAIVAVGIYVIFANSTVAQLRYELFASESEARLGARDTIAVEALRLIWQKPFLGWSMGPGFDALGFSVRGYDAAIGTHNTALLLLLDVGILGSLPVFLMTLVAVRRAWRADMTGLFIPILPALLTTFVCMFALDWLNRKTVWVLLACVFAIHRLSTRGERSAGSGDALARADALPPLVTGRRSAPL